MKRQFNFSEDKIFFLTVIWNILLFLFIFIMMGKYDAVLRSDNIYNYMFFFLLNLFLLYKYYNSCQQKRIKLIPKKMPLSIYILLGYLVNTVVSFIMEQLMIFSYGEVNVLNENLLNQRIDSNPTMFMVMHISIFLYSPIVEELLLRGLLLNSLLYFGKKFKINRMCIGIIFLLMSAFLFSRLHASDNLLTSISFGLIGLNFAIFYILSGSILVPIGIHFLNNFGLSIGLVDDAERITMYVVLLVIVSIIEYFSYKSKSVLKNLERD